MPEFKVGDLVEELDPPGGIEGEFPRSQALVIRLCPENENPNALNRPVMEIQWVATGATSLMFTRYMLIVKQ